MNDGAALLAAILAQPEEDTPRLVYADWLDENDKPERAEFIRVGCEAVKWGCTFAQTPEQPGWKHNCGTDDRGYWRCTNPRLREQELWDAHAYEWFPLLDKFRMGATARGFVSEIHCKAADFFRHAAELFASQPIDRVKITDMPIYPSGGNGTYYVGGLGQFPQKYWSRLDCHPNPAAALAALSDACIEFGRELVGLPLLFFGT